ncbi:MAG: hypothetical protein M3434_04830 [Gemmatimonadota bacterium]|nr:hypothetical protein [Gemmatimonadota bacterium]
MSKEPGPIHGEFVEHFEHLDIQPDGSPGAIPNRTALLLDDRYIKDHVIPSAGGKQYGKDTYFGRKLLYKTSSGARLVVTLPFLAEEHRNLRTARPAQFPRLADAMHLLDHLISSRYPSAVTPLVAAHSEAAIPLHLGARILERLARELVTR